MTDHESGRFSWELLFNNLPYDEFAERFRGIVGDPNDAEAHIRGASLEAWRADHDAIQALIAENPEHADAIRHTEEYSGYIDIVDNVDPAPDPVVDGQFRHDPGGRSHT